jgi:hypothetical protein
MSSFQKVTTGFIFFCAGCTLSWFLNNSQFVWGWWKDKPLVAAGIYAIPAGMLYWYGTKYAYAGLGEVWGARFMAFSASYFVFPVLTYFLLKESMFTTKTMLCVGLSLCIVLIQLFWK